MLLNIFGNILIFLAFVPLVYAIFAIYTCTRDFAKNDGYNDGYQDRYPTCHYRVFIHLRKHYKRGYSEGVEQRRREAELERIKNL